jgi:hypothetical protein
MALGGMNIDDSASYCAAACWADDIDNEVQRHVNSLSLWANGGHSKGSGKDFDGARTHGRFAVASQSESEMQPYRVICRDPLGQISPVSTVSNSVVPLRSAFPKRGS